MKSCAAALIIAALASPAGSETITFEADSAVRFVRCVDLMGMASCELIIPAGEALYSCIALDDADTPLGVAQVFSGLPAMFQQLDATLIDHVTCQKAR